MLFLVDRHSSLLVGICMECIKERYMPVLLSSISLFGKALFYTQFGMASKTLHFSFSENTDIGGGPLFGYHWFTKRGEAGPFFGIKWVPSRIVKNKRLLKQRHL